MANRYPIDNAHAMLSTAAKALGPTELATHSRIAETILGLLSFTAFDQTSSPDEFSRAQDAVALQVSYQVESGIDAFLLQNLGRGGRNLTFRGGRRMPTSHPLARKIVQAIRPRTVESGR